MIDPLSCHRRSSDSGAKTKERRRWSNAHSGRIKKKNERRVGGVGGPWGIGRETALEVDEGVDDVEEEEEEEEEEDDDEAVEEEEEEEEEERWARVAIKRTPCRVARGHPSQKTVIGNTFPPLFRK